jgi:hypothetical protein
MEWRLVRDQADLDEISRAFRGFHDACLRELHLWQDLFVDEDGGMHHPWDSKLHVRLLIQRQRLSWEPDRPSAIELWFDDATHLHVADTPVDYEGWINAGTLLKQRDIYYWAAAGGWTPDDVQPANWNISSGLAVGPVTWVAGRTLRWRDASPWMGSTPRYGAADDPGGGTS